MNYLVIGSGGPALTVPEDMIELMEDYILPGFEALAKLQQENKILAGGVPVSERAIAFIIDAASNEEARPDNACPAFMAGPGMAGDAPTELRGEGVPRPPDAATTKTGIDRESGKSGAHIPGAQRPPPAAPAAWSLPPSQTQKRARAHPNLHNHTCRSSRRRGLMLSWWVFFSA